MNFLAHAFLSFGNKEILLGNMISDFVKGKKKNDYPERISRGISLHRSIDRFTDDHAATKRAKEVFRPHYRLYSGAFIDVVYDHFLALDAGEFTESSLYSFSQQVYLDLEGYSPLWPGQFSQLFPYMKQQNWLFNYRTKEGTRKSIAGLVRRAAYMNDSETAYQLFLEHYQLLEECYRHFWADIKPFALKELDKLNGDS